jgi:hypothetical protein
VWGIAGPESILMMLQGDNGSLGDDVAESAFISDHPLASSSSSNRETPSRSELLPISVWLLNIHT